MTFDEAYAELERKLESNVEEEQTIFLPFAKPSGPVDYVFVGMEPSLGRSASTNPVSVGEEARKKREHGFKNFAWSIDDYILHYCIREYLCQDGETYYLTDLSKGAMMTKQAARDRRERYEKWYPILEEELGLVAKPKARIISIGNPVGTFLAGKGLYGHAGMVLHYSSQAARHRGSEADRQRTAYHEFSLRVALDAVVQVAREVTNEWKVSPSLQGDILERLRKKGDLTESSKRLMFDYKVSFDRIRNQDDSGWRSWRRKWRKRLASN